MGKKVLILLAALLSAFCLDAQIVDFGLGAGYSLGNEALHMKGASTSILMGPNHGFYLEPQVDFNIGKGFSVRTGLQFRKGGSDLFLDLEKLSVNLNQIAALYHKHGFADVPELNRACADLAKMSDLFVKTFEQEE